MNRRELLRLIGLGVVSHTLDVDKLLWVPGQKTIFLSTHKHISYSDIVAVELERILPHLRTLFERDSIFYEHIKTHDRMKIESERRLSIPLEIRPGRFKL